MMREFGVTVGGIVANLVTGIIGVVWFRVLDLRAENDTWTVLVAIVIAFSFMLSPASLSPWPIKGGRTDASLFLRRWRQLRAAERMQSGYVTLAADPTSRASLAPQTSAGSERVQTGQQIVAVEIVGVPTGEAQQSVREAWVGLVLPAIDTPWGSYAIWETASIFHAMGSWPQYKLCYAVGKTKRRGGYGVASAEAIELLSATKPEAADWWRENTPHLLQPGRYLVFDAEACEPVFGVRPD
jgi:hypothetical protein